MGRLAAFFSPVLHWFARLAGGGQPSRRRLIREAERLRRMAAMLAATSEREIACDEAYRLLDQFAEAVARGEDAGALLPQVKHHLELCMDCREEFEALLRILRASPPSPT